MNQESIDLAELMKSRSREIEAIEKSIENTPRKSMLFQRVPFYRRRRNRNYDKRINRKFTYRKKDRHFLRTHTYYAKRFFMIKLDYCSIPITRRIKSAKYIYKSQTRGFVFDESFRFGYVYRKGDLYNLIHGEEPDIKLKELLSGLDFSLSNKIQYFANEFEIIVHGHTIISIGKKLFDEVNEMIECIISVLNKPISSECDLSNFKSAKIFQSSLNRKMNLECSKIICKRAEMMNIYQKLISSGYIPVCLDEINRLSIENDTVSVYDNVSSELYRKIEESVNKDIIEKYMRTPASKKPKYDLSGLCLSSKQVNKYFIFSITKGRAFRGALIYDDDRPVGHVIRSEYKFSSARNYGLGFLVEEISTEDKSFYCKNLHQNNYYDIEIVKIIDFV